jgi:prevent-host-death family protein
VSTIVNVHEAKTHLSRLLDRAAAGEEIVVARAGRPVARLVALAPAPPKRVAGRLRGRITFGDGWEETPDWMIDAFEGRAVES